jgi:RNA polymerase sigma-70 factor (ECF subfamily)
MTCDQAATERAMRLIAREAAGEIDWDAVYADQLPRVYNYFRFRVANDADAEDLTSRMFEKAWRGRSQYRRDLAGFSTWLFTIAQNVAVDHLRAHRHLLPLEAAVEIIADGTPDTSAERESDLARLAALTSQLSEREQELIALKYGAGIGNREIAQLTGLSESNVGTILHRAVQALRLQW